MSQEAIIAALLALAAYATASRNVKLKVEEAQSDAQKG